MYTVLIVDDESVERDGLRFLIESKDYKLSILDAPNGEAALELLSANCVDILITDIRMPFMDGLELARRARALYPELIIMICTAYGEFEYARQAIHTGAVGYLLKPVQRAEFYGQLDAALSALDARLAPAGSDAMELEGCWYDVTHGHALDESVREAFARHGMVMDETRPILILLQFSTPALEQHTERFESGLAELAGAERLSGAALSLQGAWVIDMERAMLVFAADAMLTEVEYSALTSAVQQYAQTATGALPSLLTTQPSDGVYGVCSAWRLMEEQSDARIRAAGSIHKLGAHDSDEDAVLLERLAALLRGIERSLNKQDFAAAYTNIELFTAYMKSFNDASALYMRYMAMEVISAMIKSNPSQPVLKDALDRVFSARDVQGMICIIEEYTRELISGQQVAVADSDAVEQILKTIHEHYDEQLTLESLARGVFMTPSYVSYLFKRRTGSTLIKYIADYRMCRAAELLALGQASVTDVALMVGYDNASYFGSIFKTHYGMSPVKYRQTMAERQQNGDGI